MWGIGPHSGDIDSIAVDSVRILRLFHLPRHRVHIPGAGQVPDLHTHTHSEDWAYMYILSGKSCYSHHWGIEAGR